MTKKIISIFLACLLAFSFFGCARSKKGKTEAPGLDPKNDFLEGLEMTFDELAEEGYKKGAEYHGSRKYSFNKYEDVKFLMPQDELSGESKPEGILTTLSVIFPELVGLTAKKAEKEFDPYLTISYSTGEEYDAIGTYETVHYLFTLYPDTSGTLSKNDQVEIRLKDSVQEKDEAASSSLLTGTEPTPVSTASPAPAATPTPAPTPAPTPETVTSNIYILPQSNQRLLTYQDIANFTKQDMMLARNEIFARHGRMFNDEDVRTYFEAQEWYKGTIRPEDFNTSVLSEIESANVDFLLEYESGTNGVSQQYGNSGTVTTYGGYMIPQSSTRYLTYSDISGMSSWQLEIARNEIFARHGRRFNDDDLQRYFDAQPWYYGTIAPENFDTSVLSDVETYNVDFIHSYE